MYFKTPKSLILVIMQAILILSLLAAGPVYPQTPLAFMFFTAGLTLGTWAVWTMLSRSRLNAFPDVIDGARLITTGPYKFSRHPMYSAILLFGFSLWLNDFSSWRFFLFTLLLILLVYKLRSEEYYLSQFFPKYKDYVKTTSRLIPGIY